MASAGPRWKSINPAGGSSRGSFSVSITTGVWADFATDDRAAIWCRFAYLFTGVTGRGGASWAKAGVPVQTDGKESSSRARCSTPAVAPEDESLTGVRDGSLVTPVPSDAEHPPKAHLVQGVPQAQWCYRDESGQVLGYVYRFITSDGSKEVLPLSWCRHEVTGKCAWRWISFATPPRALRSGSPGRSP